MNERVKDANVCALVDKFFPKLQLFWMRNYCLKIGRVNRCERSFVKIEKVGHLFLKASDTTTQIKDGFGAGYGRSASLLTTVKFLVAELKHSRTSFCTNEHSGQLTTVTTYENSNEI